MTLARLAAVSLRYGTVQALDQVSLELPAGCLVGVIGPDGVGKSSLLALLAGARALQEGTLQVLGSNLESAAERRRVCPRIAYMPQGLGRNLYPTLSVAENLDFFGSLFGHDRAERAQRSAELLQATGLAPFADRAAGKLSGGMKQKLGLCCALIHDPDLLILDEPTTGVDPLSRRQFWELIQRIRARRPGLSVVVATAYMDEAAGFDWLLAMHAGRVLARGTPAELLAQTGSSQLEQAFIKLLPPAQQAAWQPVTLRPLQAGAQADIAIEARGLTMRFGDFTAVDAVSFRIPRGEIFGFIGSNGCGKTTTMKMLTGLLQASAGEALLFGHPVQARDLATRRRVGYMTQGFSLYNELTVQQNLVLHARLFGLPARDIPARVAQMAARFELTPLLDALPTALPLGERQRLSLAVALIHAPEVLILDEPTSGVDPVARDRFWNLLIALARDDKVTIFISTHFMNEAARCDRMSLMHAGKVLATDTPEALVRASGTANLEEAFVHYLSAGDGPAEPVPQQLEAAAPAPPARAPAADHGSRYERFSLRRLLSCARRENLELRRDPIRLSMALIGSALLMLVLGYGISMDVEDLRFAVLDQDQSSLSRDYVLNLSGSRYFIEQAPLRDHAELDARMRSGELSLALELPPGFARDLARGTPVQIGAWVDGAMPQRAETVLGYVQAMHQGWLQTKARELYGSRQSASIEVETRYRYNPDVVSIIAMVPAVIPLLMMLIPAILTALSVVREKELGSILNFYVTPVTRLEFLVGKQLPYIALSFVSLLLLVALSVWFLQVPLTGSLATLLLGGLLYLGAATAFGLLVSSFVRSQVAALFGTAILTILPAVQFSGLLNPVTALEGMGRVIGASYPTTHFITIARGVFSKGLGFADLGGAFLPLLLAIPVLIGISALLLRKQER